MNKTKTTNTIISELKTYATKERKEKNEYFFKTGKGQYGEGDIFIGVSMPHIRIVAKKFLDIPLKEIKPLLYNKIHEVRLCALIILVGKMKSAKIPEKTQICNFYLEHKTQVNNWDLVDSSAHYILGQAILDKIKSRDLLFELADSKLLWDRRIAMIATWILIRADDTKTTILLAKKLLGDHEDLMHKAIGWMLREAWKKTPESVETFLKTNYKKIPRTALRYAIEKMEESKRKQFLSGNF